MERRADYPKPGIFAEVLSATKCHYQTCVVQRSLWLHGEVFIEKETTHKVFMVIHLSIHSVV